MIGLKNVILISASLVLSSCLTANKCNEKFPIAPISTDSVYSKVDTIMVFRDVPYNLPSFNFSSDWWKISDLIDDKEIELPKSDNLQKGISTITKKGDSIKIKCTSDELQIIIDSLILEAEINQLTINKLESVYTDTKAENKKLKILTKENVQNAKANKNKALSKIFMWIFLSIALITLAVSIFKFKK
jgi:hypothetical protein